MTEEIVRLADQIKGSRKTQTPVVKGLERLTYENAWYLCRTNSYIKRGVDITAGAITRNGIEFDCATKRDEKVVDEFIRRSLFYDKLDTTVENTVRHGWQVWELYDTKSGPDFALMPIPETTFIMNAASEVEYDSKTGMPKGFVQKRNGKEIAKVEMSRAAHFKFAQENSADLGISMLEAAIYPAKEFGFIRDNIAESYIRCLPVVHMTVEGGTVDDITEVSASLQGQFTAETVYVTSERYKIEPKSTTAYNIQMFNFTEPAIADIAAAFNVPIEMIAATKNLKTDDFAERYIEWVAHIKGLQHKIERVLERDVFDLLTSKPVDVRFNSPEAIPVDVLLQQIGFATQSGAISEEDARQLVEETVL